MNGKQHKSQILSTLRGNWYINMRMHYILSHGTNQPIKQKPTNNIVEHNNNNNKKSANTPTIANHMNIWEWERSIFEILKKNRSSNTSSSWYGKWCMPVLCVFNFIFAHSPACEIGTHKKNEAAAAAAVATATKCVVLQRERMCEYFKYIYLFSFSLSLPLISFISKTIVAHQQQQKQQRNKLPITRN